MKIRIENQEIRFRISEEEKAFLITGNMLSVHLVYGQGILNSQSYSLLVSDDVNKIRLKISNGIFEIELPKSYIDDWIGKKVGFEEIIQITDSNDLKVIVEKDLKRSKR
jgi:cell division protein FtsL